MRDILSKIEKETWFPKPQNKKFDIKTIKPLQSKIKLSLGHLINSNCPLKLFDSFIKEYESIIHTFITFIIEKDKTLSQGIFLSGRTDRSARVRFNLWGQDLFAIDRLQDQQRAALRPSQSQTY